MRKFVLISLAAVAGLIALFLVVVALQPSEFHVVRSATIAAPAATVFGQVNDLRKWNAWSPWAKRDPNARNTFEGAEEGEGAIFHWAGNQEVGEGSMTIVESRPHERIGIRLDFLKPFASTADVQFTFQPQGERTVVTWSMDGENNFIAKAICLFMDMDQMIGSDFEAGLAHMNEVVSKVSEEPKPEE
jgi:uncharacterized protein YndB with AHSA1/START domain